MKANFFKNLNWLSSLAIILSLSLFLASCNDDNDDVVVEPTPELVTANSSDIMAIPFFVETVDGNLPSNNSDLLYENRTHAPVTAPDGHQVTWGEFSAVQGNISVRMPRRRDLLQSTSDQFDSKRSLYHLECNGQISRF